MAPQKLPCKQSIVCIFFLFLFPRLLFAQSDLPDTMRIEKKVTGFSKNMDGTYSTTKARLFTVNSGRTFEYMGYRYKTMAPYLTKYPEPNTYYQKARRAAGHRLIAAGATVLTFYGGLLLVVNYEGVESRTVMIAGTGISATCWIANYSKMRKNIKKSVTAYNRQVLNQF